MQKHYNYLDIDLDSKNYRKLRAMQGDTKSRYILVNLYSNNLAYDLSHCTVKIYGLKRDKTIFFNNAVVKNAKLGQFEIELTNQALAVPGELKVQILVLGTDGEKLTSSAFFIDVGESIIDENAIESTNEFGALTESLTKVNEWNGYFEETSGKIEEKYTERLNNVDSQLEQSVNNMELKQTDYIDLLLRQKKNTILQLKKLYDDDSNRFEVVLSDGSNHVTYDFFRSMDDYLVQGTVYGGKIGRVLSQDVMYDHTQVTKTGTFTENGIIYTTEIGASFEKELVVTKGQSICLTLNTRNDGGLWEITLNGLNPKNVSSYTEASMKSKFEVYSDLEAGVYLIKGVYRGIDPNNVVTNPRGWLNSEGNPLVTLETSFIDNIKDFEYCTPSNKEFAFRFMPINGGTSTEFVPYHGTPTAFKVEEYKVFNNGQEVDVFNMNAGDIIELDEFILSQHIYARHPETGDRNILEIWTNTTITKDGMLSVDGKLKVLEETKFEGSYVIMGVAKNDIFDLCVSGFANRYICTAQDNSQTKLIDETDKCGSYIFLSSTDTDKFVAFRYNNISETLRQNEEGKGTLEDNIYLQHRDKNVLKLYNKIFNSYTALAGYTLRFSGDYIFNTIPNIYNLLG